MVLKLYGFPASHCTRRVALICKEMNVPYELVVVDMLKDEHKAPVYLEHQPFGQVPYIDDDGFQLFESRAIGRYIATKYATQGPRLIPDPSDIQSWARYEQAASIELSNFDPYMNELAWENIFKKFAGGATDETVVANLLQTLNTKLDAYEVILSKSAYLAGEEVTLADLFHLPFGNTLGLMGYDLLTTNRRPNVAKWWKTISSRSAWQAVKDSA
ncbi:glutathione transferase [Wolfiporia cocos MD-104 SS10]|uniref:glutathione transferase n=1 Tax=Wolfiporia cocos (strain MD-104) TaxID=742152 RepID=A0A2H3IWY6_WOLCO|nr:glutathione transferase [Wolfiporia cocos MD-104 SS10]